MLKRNGIGGASIALIFVVLCMVIFTTISFVFALSQDAMIKNEVESVVAYYEADTLAEAVLANILASPATPGNVMDVEISSRFDIGLGAEVVYFTIPITDMSELYVAVAIDGVDYTVLSWRIYPTGYWEADEGINIFQGFDDILGDEW